MFAINLRAKALKRGSGASRLLHQTIPIAKISISHRSSSALRSELVLLSPLCYPAEVKGYWREKKGLRLLPLQHQQRQMGFACRLSLDSPQRLQVWTQSALWAAVVPRAGHYSYPAEVNNALYCCAEAEKSLFLAFIKFSPSNELLYGNWSLTPHRFSFASFMLCKIVWVSLF